MRSTKDDILFEYGMWWTDRLSVKENVKGRKKITFFNLLRPTKRCSSACTSNSSTQTSCLAASATTWPLPPNSYTPQTPSSLASSPRSRAKSTGSAEAGERFAKRARTSPSETPGCEMPTSQRPERRFLLCSRAGCRLRRSRLVCPGICWGTLRFRRLGESSWNKTRNRQRTVLNHLQLYTWTNFCIARTMIWAVRKCSERDARKFWIVHTLI